MSNGSDKFQARRSCLRSRKESECLRDVSFLSHLRFHKHFLISGHRLQERNEVEWAERVTLLFGDMRTIDVPEKADILVSELLGSFGDNELSPECLDGAMRFLKGTSPVYCA